MNADLFAQHALSRLAKVGADALTDQEKTVATVWLFAAGVSNSGFIGYFSSSRGDLACHAPDALAAIGAPRLAGIAAQANAVFGSKGPPMNRGFRRELTRGLSSECRRRLALLDQQYFDCDEDIDELLEHYVTAHAVTA